MTTTTNRRTVWQLARLADCADPDSSGSAGADFLHHVHDATVEAVRWLVDEDGHTLAEAVEVVSEDQLSEIADGCVPVYTADLWRTFTDLAGWDIDTDDYGTPADMNDGARWALYVVAERLISALCADMDTLPDDEDVPADWPVRPVPCGTVNATTCGACGRSWDDTIPTSMTPVPAARCPFEAFH